MFYLRRVILVFVLIQSLANSLELDEDIKLELSKLNQQGQEQLKKEISNTVKASLKKEADRLSEEDKLPYVKVEAPFPGYIYRPKGGKSHPAIIFLHGSEGGNSDYYQAEGFNPELTGENGTIPNIAKYYASQGFVTYALCYFDCRKNHKGYENYPPDNFAQIDIFEHVYKPLEWLKNSELVDGNKVILWGGSKGAELSLVLSSYLAKLNENGASFVLPDAVMSLSPSDRIGLASYKDPNSNQLVTLYSSPSYIFGTKEFKPWETIEVQHYKKPLIINYMTSDPLWGPMMNPMVSYYKFLGGNIQPMFLSINKDMKFEDFYAGYNQSPVNLTGATFVQFNFEGHVFVDQSQYQEASNIQNTINYFFLNQVLSQ